MPCAICENWIPSESQVYRAEKNADGDGRTVYILRTLAGTEEFRVATLDVETISKTLAVRDYRIKIMKKAKAIAHNSREIAMVELRGGTPSVLYQKIFIWLVRVLVLHL